MKKVSNESDTSQPQNKERKNKFFTPAMVVGLSLMASSGFSAMAIAKAYTHINEKELPTDWNKTMTSEEAGKIIDYNWAVQLTSLNILGAIASLQLVVGAGIYTAALMKKLQIKPR